MAVKHKVQENRDGQDSDRLHKILRTLQDINSERQLSHMDLSQMCETIVAMLSTINMPKSPENYVNFATNVQKAQDFLALICSSQDLIFVTLKALYNHISDPKLEPSPTMSIVLQLINPTILPAAVNWILRIGYSEQSLEQALLTLCKWLSQWTLTENLGPLVLCFMEGLEYEQHYDILVEVTLRYIERLFRLIIIPMNRKFVAPVVFHMLRSMQQSPEAFHKIIPNVKSVLTLLNKENTESSLKCEAEIATLCIALMKHFPDYPIYEELNEALENYKPTATYKQVLNYNSWQDTTNSSISLTYTTGKVGLNNLGNTCYMNSILQALFMTKLFRNDILLSTRDAMPLIAKLQSLFALLQFSQRPSLSPTEVLNVARPPGFQPGQQQDSSEFMGYLLDVLHEQERTIFSATQIGDGPSISGNPNETSNQLTVVQKSFGGRGVTVSRCSTCQNQSERADNFRELQLSFPNDTESISVQALLDYYLEPEKLCDDNQYHCDNCRRLTDGVRITRVIEPPPRLVLTLKEFRYDPTTQTRAKILQRVNLDSVINLENTEYELYATVVHCGSSMDSGHYYTFAREEQDWYKFNDCSVVKTKSEELNGLKSPETPYILFYRKMDSSEPESVSKGNLSGTLQSLLARDSTEVESERRKRAIKFNSNRIIRKDDDEPPPPGCGGGGIIDNSFSRFVC